MGFIQIKDANTAMKSIILLVLLASLAPAAEAPMMSKEDVFPLDAKHNHASSLVRLPNGDLFVCWYRGSGERTADDVAIMAARKRAGAGAWSPPFVLADTPGFPDTNPTLFVDRRNQLWLFWQTIVANRWETAITNYRMSADYKGEGVPKWALSEVMFLKPKNFAERVKAVYPDKPQLEDKFAQRMGWMTRAHPVQLPNGRIVLGLYSDGWDVSLAALSDDDGATWRASEPIVSAAGIQPAFARRRDGSIVAFLRDNGPPPKRVQASVSSDGGETWTVAKDTEIPNSGTGLEVLVLKDGRWLLINNDTERGRNSLALTLSDDEGATWKWTRHLELDSREKGAGSFHYPSILQAPDGSIHASYSVFLNHIPEGQPRKTIRHAHFNLAWIEQGDPK